MSEFQREKSNATTVGAASTFMTDVPASTQPTSHAGYKTQGNAYGQQTTASSKFTYGRVTTATTNYTQTPTSTQSCSATSAYSTTASKPERQASYAGYSTYSTYGSASSSYNQTSSAYGYGSHHPSLTGAHVAPPLTPKYGSGPPSSVAQAPPMQGSMQYSQHPPLIMPPPSATYGVPPFGEEIKRQPSHIYNKAYHQDYNKESSNPDYNKEYNQGFNKTPSRNCIQEYNRTSGYKRLPGQVYNGSLDQACGKPSGLGYNRLADQYYNRSLGQDGGRTSGLDHNRLPDQGCNRSLGQDGGSSSVLDHNRLRGQDFGSALPTSCDRPSGSDYSRLPGQFGNRPPGGFSGMPPGGLGYNRLADQYYNRSLGQDGGRTSGLDHNRLPDQGCNRSLGQDGGSSSALDHNRLRGQDFGSALPTSCDRPSSSDYSRLPGQFGNRPPGGFSGMPSSQYPVDRRGPSSGGLGSSRFEGPSVGPGFRSHERGGFKGASGKYGDHDGRNTSYGEVMQDTIFVSGLPETVNEDDLSEYFGEVGVIKKDKSAGAPRIWIYKDKESGKGKGKATITYEDPPTALSAVDFFGGKEFQGKRFNIQLSQRKSARMGGPGFGRYGRGPGDGPGRFGNGPSGRGGVSGRDGDWKCPNPECYNNNFSWRSECNRCHAPKPVGDLQADRFLRGTGRDKGMVGRHGGFSDRDGSGRDGPGGSSSRNDFDGNGPGVSGPIRRRPGGERDDRRQRPY